MEHLLAVMDGFPNTSLLSAVYGYNVSNNSKKKSTLFSSLARLLIRLSFGFASDLSDSKKISTNPETEILSGDKVAWKRHLLGWYKVTWQANKHQP